MVLKLINGLEHEGREDLLLSNSGGIKTNILWKTGYKDVMNIEFPNRITDKVI